MKRIPPTERRKRKKRILDLPSPTFKLGDASSYGYCRQQAASIDTSLYRAQEPLRAIDAGGTAGPHSIRLRFVPRGRQPAKRPTGRSAICTIDSSIGTRSASARARDRRRAVRSTRRRTARQRIVSFLQEVFETTFSFDLEVLHKKGLKQANKQLLRYQAASDFVVAWVTLYTLGGHSIPLDAPILRVLRRLGLIEADRGDSEALRSSLEHVIPKVRGPLIGELVSASADEFCWRTTPIAQLVRSAPPAPPVRKWSALLSLTAGKSPQTALIEAMQARLAWVRSAARTTGGRRRGRRLPRRQAESRTGGRSGRCAFPHPFSICVPFDDPLCSEAPGRASWTRGASSRDVALDPHRDESSPGERVVCNGLVVRASQPARGGDRGVRGRCRV